LANLTAVSLFAGVGGFDLALERNGVKVVAAVEIDKNARTVLEQRFPDTKLFNDVTEVTADDLRAAGFVPERGIITGGFPDNWTEGQSDSARYRQMGNAVAVPVVEWIIERLVAVDSE